MQESHGFNSKLNKTTIYRVLDKLEQDGILHSFLGNNGLKWYAKCTGCSASEHKDVHPHFQCLDCGKMDCIPTNVTLPTTIDGLSLHPLLTGENETIGHEILYWFGGEQAAIRSGKWKYRWANDAEDSFAKRSSDYEGVALEVGHFLTNLEKDPGELENLATTENDVLERLQEDFNTWKTNLKIID